MISFYSMYPYDEMILNKSLDFDLNKMVPKKRFIKIKLPSQNATESFNAGLCFTLLTVFIGHISLAK